GMFYYVMQYIQGLGLDQILIELRRLHAAKTGAQGKAIADAVVHRAADDVSAVNVAQSLLTGRFANPIHPPAEESKKPAAPALTATLTQKSSSAGPAAPAPAPAENTVPESPPGASAPRPRDNGSGNGSTSLGRSRQL